MHPRRIKFFAIGKNPLKDNPKYIPFKAALEMVRAGRAVECGYTAIREIPAREVAISAHKWHPTHES